MSMFAINVIHFIFRLFGMAPFTIHQSQPLNRSNTTKKMIKLSIVFSKLGAIYNLILMLILSVVLYEYMPDVLKKSLPDHSELSKNLWNFLVFYGNVITIISLFIYSMKQRYLTIVGNRLIEVKTTLKQISREYPSGIGTSSILLVLILNIIFTLIYIGTGIVRLGGQLGLAVIVTFHDIPLNFCMLQYGFVVSFIEKQFRNLNDTLKFLENTSTGDNRTNSIEILPSQSVLRSVIVIKRVYSCLHELCIEIADFYAALTIFIVIHSSTGLLFCVYYMVTRSGHGQFQESMTILYYCSELSWIVIKTFPLITLTTRIRKGYIEMTKTAGIANEFQEKLRDHGDLKLELKRFVLHLMHQDPHLTAYGLMTIDCALLKSIFTTVVGYLVIFIQFQMAHFEKKQKTAHALE